MYDASRLKMENEIYCIFFIFSAKLVSDMANPNRSFTSHWKLQDCIKKKKKSDLKFYPEFIPSYKYKWSYYWGQKS